MCNGQQASFPIFSDSSGAKIKKKRTAQAWLPDPNDLADEDLVGILTTLNDCAEKANVRLWLLIDEAEGLLDLEKATPRFLHRLRGLIQNCSALNTVMVAAKNIVQASHITSEAGMSPCQAASPSGTSAV